MSSFILRLAFLAVVNFSPGCCISVSKFVMCGIFEVVTTTLVISQRARHGFSMENNLAA